MITDKEAYGLAFTDRLGWRAYIISSLLHEKKKHAFWVHLRLQTDLGLVCANWKGLELLLPLPTCGLMSTSKGHEATPSLSIWGWPGVTASNSFPFVSKSSPPKNTLFWRNRALFPVASRSNARCSKAQVASYLAQIRRFLVPTA